MTEKKTELLDQLEELIVLQTHNFLKQIQKEITKEEARRIVGKIGVRIAFEKEIGKKYIDKIL